MSYLPSWVHGSRHGYQLGCRCLRCMSAERDYSRRAKQIQRERLVRALLRERYGPTDALEMERHGSVTQVF